MCDVVPRYFVQLFFTGTARRRIINRIFINYSILYLYVYLNACVLMFFSDSSTNRAVGAVFPNCYRKFVCFGGTDETQRKEVENEFFYYALGTCR